MDFTIITPSLNYGHFIGECLESVAMQHEVTLEHLVIDGGSTDHSAEVAANFPHVSWIQEPDNGMSDAINKGFDRAQGEWVMWLNADDRIKPGALEDILAKARGTHADIVYGDFDFIDAHGKFKRRIRTPRWSRFVHVHHHCFIGSTAAFYRRSAVIDAGYRLRTDFGYAMDSEFYARLDQAGLRFQRVSVNVADFRMHGTNLSQRNLGKALDMDRILKAEKQFAESRAIRRAYGITCFGNPYLNGLVDGILWIIAKAVKPLLKI